MSRRRLPYLLPFVALLAAGSAASCADHDEPVGELACQVKPSTTFHERIEPLLSSDHISTCNECHLSGVDLTTFARSTPCQTWVCLLDQGLVDVANPENSKILAWIARASPDSALITPAVIAAEHDAFRDWIDVNAACPSACHGVRCDAPGEAPHCSDGAKEVDDAIAANQGGMPNLPADSTDQVDCSDLALERAFADDVYTWRGRCSPCHVDSHPDADPLAPRWISTLGNCNNGSAVTFKNARDLGILNADDPTQSLILLKPLDQAGGGVKHGGGEKFEGTSDLTYQSFVRFLNLYHRCRGH